MSYVIVIEPSNGELALVPITGIKLPMSRANPDKNLSLYTLALSNAKTGDEAFAIMHDWFDKADERSREYEKRKCSEVS